MKALVLTAFMTGSMSACADEQKPPTPAIGNFDLTPQTMIGGEFVLVCRSEVLSQSEDEKRYLNRFIRVFTDGSEIVESEIESGTPC